MLVHKLPEPGSRASMLRPRRSTTFARSSEPVLKGANVPDAMGTREGEVVQDADRLDAIGAIGIGRAFAYGGHVGQVLYDPAAIPEMQDSPGAYFNTQGTTLQHFSDKLLLL